MSIKSDKYWRKAFENEPNLLTNINQTVSDFDLELDHFIAVDLDGMVTFYRERPILVCEEFFDSPSGASMVYLGNKYNPDDGCYIGCYTGWKYSVAKIGSVLEVGEATPRLLKPDERVFRGFLEDQDYVTLKIIYEDLVGFKNFQKDNESSQPGWVTFDKSFSSAGWEISPCVFDYAPDPCDNGDNTSEWYPTRGTWERLGGRQFVTKEFPATLVGGMKLDEFLELTGKVIDGIGGDVTAFADTDADDENESEISVMDNEDPGIVDREEEEPQVYGTRDTRLDLVMLLTRQGYSPVDIPDHADRLIKYIETGK